MMKLFNATFTPSTTTATTTTSTTLSMAIISQHTQQHKITKQIKNTSTKFKRKYQYKNANNTSGKLAASTTCVTTTNIVSHYFGILLLFYCLLCCQQNTPAAVVAVALAAPAAAAAAGSLTGAANAAAAATAVGGVGLAAGLAGVLGAATPLDITNANLTDLGSPAPKYQTAYACEGKKLTIECDPGDLINLIRANYGRFSITICNDHGNVEWSVNCMFPKSLTVLNSRCSHKQSCSVLATTSMFGDPCPGTHKYLEAHYQCISAAQTSTTTNRPSPPWLLTNTPPLLANGSTPIIPAVVAMPPRLPATNNGILAALPASAVAPTQQTIPLTGVRMKTTHNNATNKNGNRHDGLPPPPPLYHHHHHNGHHAISETHGNNEHQKAADATNAAASANGNGSFTTAPPNTRILGGVSASSSSSSSSNNDEIAQKTTVVGITPTSSSSSSTTSASNIGGGNFSIIRTINNINNINAGLVSDEDDTNLFCGPTNARNMFWNTTRVGDVNVQPCPGGATGIAKWRCVLMKRLIDDGFDDDLSVTSTEMPTLDCKNNNSNCENPLTLANKVSQHLRNFEPTWHPVTPDLTQCRSLWLNNLEVRVNQRDSSLISIANDLSEVTSSKTLYGGDMLVTTKIIQTMSEKMYHDKETFPDQRQREAMILELLHGVVKTGSNLLDESQLSSWLDLNQEDQMRVATSLLTGLEYNAFLLADTIIRERNVVQKVKNILLSVRVLETKNIQSNEIFPDAEQWQISNDRIELPRAALLANSEGGLVRIVFAAFDRLESILKPSYDHFDQKSARSYVRNTAIVANETNDVDLLQQQRVRILNSKVISASLGKGRHIQLTQPIKLVLRHLKVENVSNPTCVFWNYIDHAWSANGCSLESTNRTHSICMCNHLTNFAILMDVMDEHNHALFGVFDGNLRVIIYIGIAICIVFIVIALLTLKIFNGVFTKSARTSIYRSIYFCLFFVEILFLFGIEQTETSIFCGFTTVFLHCSILSAIAWFCFEAFQSYSTLTTDDMLIEVDQTPKVNCYYLLSYGLSLTIVAISLIINPSTYTRNDYCVLMEANTLFYVSFVIPVLLFFVAALVYTFLSWIIMCRKSRTTLKNKEHTRLAIVRFDIRCSFIFLLLLSAVWICAYFYLRRAKAEDENTVLFGYFFAGFNALMGVYIFIFHCIQNEKIRREYRKYVRQNSWLPKCLRCSKTSISSGIGGSAVGGSSNVGAVGNIVIGNSTANQLKNSKISADDLHENDETGGIITAADDVITATSDCELNETLMRRTGGSGSTLKSGILPGSMLQHAKTNSIVEAMPGQIVLERTAAAVGVGGTSTSRSTAGMYTPSAGHTSPTSSAGSTHLIFGHGHKQPAQAAGSMLTASHEAYYHQPDYYSWKQKGKMPLGYNAADVHAAVPQQPHEYFYWTQKHTPHGKKKRGSAVGPDSPSGSLHSRTTAASQILFYPSYKKTTVKNQQTGAVPSIQQYAHYAEAIEPTAAYYPQHQQQQLQQQQQRHAVRHAAANNAAFATLLQQQQQQQHQHYLQQQQQQLSSDDEQIESAAHAHLLHLNRHAAFGTPHAAHALQHQQQQQQRYYRNKHSNCDLNQDFDLSLRGNDAYYNQGSLSGSIAGDGPVYEEILSNRGSDVPPVRLGGVGTVNEQQQLAHYQRNGGSGRFGNARAVDEDDDDDENESVCDEHNDVDDDDDDEDVEDEEDDSATDNHLNARHELPQSDERMRRLMAMQDQDFQRRFQRQQRKKAMNDAVGLANMPANAYHEFEQSHHANNGFTAISNGAGSVRSYKKTSPSGRLAVNELFSQGPPLPPANQHPMQKRQQLPPQQQISPSSQTAVPQIAQQQQPVGRNISAMLDENNTVRCYLEPLAK